MAHIDPRLVVEASPVLAAGTEVRLEGWIMIGRSPTSDLVLDDPFVSQTHARVVPRGQLHFVEDLGSTNGTFVNGREVVEAQLLLDTEVRIGETIFRYEE
jgi:pSer/pThr/pTyr-binding forkhead associated (FHA) protein